jgi:lysozyme
MSITTDYNNAIVQRDFWLAEVTRLSALLVKDGPDVAQYQGVIDWTKVAANSGFAFVRVSDGNDTDDEWSGTRVGQLRQSGIPWFPYHFGRCAAPLNNERNGRIEAGMAIHFAHNAGWGRPGDLPMAYDIEKNPPPADGFNGQDPAKVAKHVIQWIKTYQWTMQHWPLLYSNPVSLGLIRPHMTDADKVVLANCVPWIAHWGTMTPALPPPWSLDGIYFQQYTNQGVAPGITGPVDLNRFSGSATDLNALRIS